MCLCACLGMEGDVQAHAWLCSWHVCRCMDYHMVLPHLQNCRLLTQRGPCQYEIYKNVFNKESSR